MGVCQVRLRERNVPAQYRKVRVPHELLKLEEVAAAAEEVDREGVPQGVWAAPDAPLLLRGGRAVVPLRNQAGSYAVEGSAQAAQAALPLLGRQLLEAKLDLNLRARGFHRSGQSRLAAARAARRRISRRLRSLSQRERRP